MSAAISFQLPPRAADQGVEDVDAQHQVLVKEVPAGQVLLGPLENPQIDLRRVVVVEELPVHKAVEVGARGAKGGLQKAQTARPPRLEALRVQAMLISREVDLPADFLDFLALVDELVEAPYHPLGGAGRSVSLHNPWVTSVYRYKIPLSSAAVNARSLCE